MDTTAMHNEIRPDEDLVEMLDFSCPALCHDDWIHTLKFGLSKQDILRMACTWLVLSSNPCSFLSVVFQVSSNVRVLVTRVFRAVPVPARSQGRNIVSLI